MAISPSVDQVFSTPLERVSDFAFNDEVAAVLWLALGALKKTRVLPLESSRSEA
jgi:hypothetical protein